MVSALLTYLGAHWALAIATTLGVVGLGAAAFFLRNWKIALAAIALAAAGFMYQGAVTDGIKIQMAKEAQVKIAVLQSHLDAVNKTNELNAVRAQEDETKIAELERQANDTPKNSGACFDIDATRRVFNIK